MVIYPPPEARPFLLITTLALTMFSAMNLGIAMRPAPLVYQQGVVSRQALVEAARVYGKAGCGDYLLVEQTAAAAEKVGISPALLAAKVSVESTCNRLAVSSKGAIGLTQVRPAIWDCTRPRSSSEPCWDFSKINLLSPETSLIVGATIMKYYVDKHGLERGVAAYNGKGEEAREYSKEVIGRAK